jgi:hypothetical protein
MEHFTGFEEDPKDRRNRLICRICSDAGTALKEVSINRGSKSSHLTSRGHLAAVQALAEKSSSLDDRPHQAVALSFVDILGSSSRRNDPPEPSQRPPSPFGNPFSDVVQYERPDEFFNGAGEQILFSAGTFADPLATQRKEIQQQIDHLSNVPNHSIFGQVSEELEDEAEPELTVDGAFAATLRRMGRHLIHSQGFH